MADGLRPLIQEIGAFSQAFWPDRMLRDYQLEAARAVVRSVLHRQGRQFVVAFSRQSVKDEMLAQTIAYLLIAHMRRGGAIVVAAPAFMPQAALSRDRLLALLRLGLPGEIVEVKDGYVVQAGNATARFLSASPVANARGQTADLLLVANEAQDIDPATWDAVFDPMAASTNATTLLMGTVWDRSSLLSRQMRHLDGLTAVDGQARVFRAPWQRVALEVPVYGERVRQRIAQFGEDHPFIQTEYCLRELDGEGGLFPPQRLAQMQGDHARRSGAEAGKRYALLIDVAGEEEAGAGVAVFQSDARRDSTAVTVVEIVATDAARPSYRVVDRMAWTGERHVLLHDRLVDLARNVWRASVVVIDATGVGAGLTSYLAATLARESRTRVVPFIFTSASKSDLGWTFLGLIDSGRFKEYADDSRSGTGAGCLTAIYQSQLRATTYETGSGPGRRLQWGVPVGAGHDDLVVSAALCSALEEIDWRPKLAVGSSR